MKTHKILITGDFFGGSSRVKDLIETEQFDLLYGDLLPIIKDNDLTITNLESPLIEKGTPIAKTGPAIKASPKTVKALNFGHINMVTLANNHILDFGEEGLQTTLAVLKSNGIDYLGAGEAKERATKYVDFDKTRIGIVNICENEWSTSIENQLRANSLNPIANFYQIAEAKKQADKVIVIFHGGNEYYQLPSPSMKETCRFFVDSGADFVFCHHTHCFSGHEQYQHGTIFYGLGNFIFDNLKFRNNSWNLGLAVQLHFTESQVGYTLIPYRQCDNQPGVQKLNEEELLAFEKQLQHLNHIISNDQLLEESYTKFAEKVKKQYINYIQPYSNKYLNAAYKRGLLPSLLTAKKKLLLSNLIRCESHREVLLKILNKQI
jgi:hypothetical protein